MSDKNGLLKTQIRLVKKDEELIDRIMIARDFPEEEREAIIEILRYNVWTIKQFSDLTGFVESTISNKTRPLWRGGELVTELDHCYPFADIEGLGPKFIVRNQKSEAMLPQEVKVPEEDDAV